MLPGIKPISPEHSLQLESAVLATRTPVSPDGSITPRLSSLLIQFVILEEGLLSVRIEIPNYGAFMYPGKPARKILNKKALPVKSFTLTQL